jgi:CheY-like chemotaxis protein
MRSPERRPALADHASRHVLVMNDAPELIELMQTLLEEEGYRVSTALHTLDLGPVRALAPDVIVLDLLFEHQLKGWHFLTMARLDRELSRIPIVLCTAAVMTVEPLLANLAAQQVRVIYKPFDIDQLLFALDEALRGVPILPPGD